MAQKRICKLFNLPKEDFIYEDFTCALSTVTKIPIHGRLFCMENYLCFYAAIMGIEKKVFKCFVLIKF
jgi:GRAM domain.